MRVIIFLFLVSASRGFLFSGIPYTPKETDCAWLPWTYSRCVRVREGVYKQEETRSTIKAQNGGKDCAPGPSTRISNTTCTEEDYLTSVIIRTMGTTRGSSYTISIASAAYKPQGIPFCPKQFTGSQSGVTLTGYKCNLSQKLMHARRRRANTPPLPFNGAIRSIEHRDVVFLIDESGSVGSRNFQMELEFVKELARKFCKERIINFQKTRVALTTFTNDYIHHIDFDDYTDEQSFRTAVDKVSYRGGMTCMVKALNGVRDEMFTLKRGSRVENINSNGVREADGLIILITDGCFNCFPGNLELELKKQQKRLEDKGIFLMSFMINVGGSCKEKFQYLYEGSVCFQGYSYPSWTAFQNQINDLKRQSACIDRWDKNDVDCP